MGKAKKATPSTLDAQIGLLIKQLFCMGNLLFPYNKERVGKPKETYQVLANSQQGCYQKSFSKFDFILTIHRSQVAKMV